MNPYINIYMSHIYVYICIYVYLYLFTCMNIHVYSFTYTYVCTHRQIHYSANTHLGESTTLMHTIMWVLPGVKKNVPQVLQCAAVCCSVLRCVAVC